MKTIEKLAAHRTPLIALAIVIAMLAIAIALRLGAAVPLHVPFAQAEEERDTNIMTRDSDGDGAPDWKESLLGTDPNNATSVPRDNAFSATSSTAQSVTEQFARSVLYNYLSGTKGGQTHLADPQAVGEQIANSIGAPAPAFTPYTAAELSLVASTPQSRAAYKDALDAAFAPLRTIHNPEIWTYAQVVSGTEGARTELEAIIAAYKRAAANTMALEVPSDAVAMNVSTANALAYYAATLEQLLRHTNDPVGSLTILSAYNEAERNVFTAFDMLRSYFALD